MMRHASIPALVALAALASTACELNLNGDGVVVREEQRFALSGEADLAINTFDGDIRVQSWDRNEVLVEIEKRGSTREEAEQLEVRTTQDGNRIRLEASTPRGRRSGFRVGNFVDDSVSFAVTVPRNLALRAETGDGSITASALSGRIELRSGDGGIRGESLTGDLVANTGDGPVAIAGVSGRVDVGSGDGEIEVRGRLEGVRVDTGDGPVTVEAESGSVMSDDWQVTTGDGAIELRVPAGFNAEIDANSGDGQISAEGATITAAQRNDDDPQLLRGRLGSGGRTIRLRSGDGSIRIVTR